MCLPLAGCDVNAKGWKNKLVIAGIDFGTTYSGYVLSYLKDTCEVGDVKIPRMIVPHWMSDQVA